MESIVTQVSVLGSLASPMAITDDDLLFSVNGTACAIPRMLIAICEQFQTINGSVVIPVQLRPYMRNKEMMEPKPRKQRLNFTYITSAKHFEKNKNL